MRSEGEGVRGEGGKGGGVRGCEKGRTSHMVNKMSSHFSPYTKIILLSRE